MKISLKSFWILLLAIFGLYFSIQPMCFPTSAAAQGTKDMATKTTDHAQKNEDQVQEENVLKRSNNETANVGIDPKMELNPEYVLGRYIVPGLIFLAGVAGIFIWVIIATRRKRSK